MTFYALSESGEPAEAFLRITAITGNDRENRAVRGNRFSLKRWEETIYVAELLEGNERWNDGITEDEVRAAFSLIDTEWVSGDNY